MKPITFIVFTVLTSAITVMAAPLALETTASGNTVQQNNLGLDLKINSLGAALQAAINNINACANDGKMFASDPATPGRDANGCIDATATAPTPTPTSGTLPDAAVCGRGNSLISNGSSWSCPVTLDARNPPPPLGADYYADTQESWDRFCVERGYTSALRANRGGDGCSSCDWARWNGSSWQRRTSVSSYHRIYSIVCY